MNRKTRALSGLIFGCLTLVGAQASEVVIDESKGAAFSGLVDGFPNVFPFDGTADAPDNFGIGFRAGVTEERGIAEFPLAPLDAVCLTPNDIVGATLSFNIDDVLASFGPGTEFTGEASAEILIHPFSGNGVVGIFNPFDFQAIFAPPVSVDTTTFGVITDQSLVSSGPLPFSVDVTTAVQAEFSNAGTHQGFVFRTTDSPTGTSLDNLGDMAAGPPGVNGSKLPELTIETGPLHLFDLRCEGDSTVCSWDAQTGDLSYDVVRGDITQLSASVTNVDLGVVTCIEAGSSDLSTTGDEDGDIPLPGDAFFYVMRPTTDGGQGTYGNSSDCLERIPTSGDCEAEPMTATFMVDVTMDGDSRWLDYFSDAFGQVDGGPFYGGLGGINDGFYLISSLPSFVNIGSGADIFPFNEQFDGVGSVTYVTDGLSNSGTEVATIASIDFDFDEFCADNDAVVNDGYTTTITSFSGTVTLEDGVVAGINLTADLFFTYDFSGFGAGDLPFFGTLSITNDAFVLDADSSYPSGFPNDIRFVWDLDGTVENLTP